LCGALRPLAADRFRRLLVNCLIGDLSNPLLPIRVADEREVQGRRGAGALQRESFSCVGGEFVGERQSVFGFKLRDIVAAAGTLRRSRYRGDVRRGGNCLVGSLSNPLCSVGVCGEREVQGRRGAGAPQRQSIGRVSGDFVGDSQSPVRFRQGDNVGAIGVVERGGLRGDARRGRVAIDSAVCHLFVNCLVGRLSSSPLPVRVGGEGEGQGRRDAGALQRQSFGCVGGELVGERQGPICSQ